MGLTFPLSVLACLAVAQHAAVSAPLGALQADSHSTEAQGPHSLESDGPSGAPRTFDLFFPKAPRQYTSSQNSSTPKYEPVVETTERQQAVPDVSLPIPTEEEDTNVSIPVIQLPEESNNSDGAITNDTIPTFLDMFPEDLLNSDKIVKPIQIHIIEHDDYIDYEIEFIELSMDEASETENYSDKKVDLSFSEKDIGEKGLPVSTLKKSHADSDSFLGVTSSTFLDLLKRARIRHKEENKLPKLAIEDNETSTVISEEKVNGQTNKQENEMGRRQLKRKKTPRKIDHRLLRNPQRIKNKLKHGRGVNRPGNILKYNNNKRSTTSRSPPVTKMSTEISTSSESENHGNLRNQNTNEKEPGLPILFENNTMSNILDSTETQSDTTMIPYPLVKFNDKTTIHEDIQILPTTEKITKFQDQEQSTSHYEYIEITTLPEEDTKLPKTTTMSLIDKLKQQLLHISELKENHNCTTESPPSKTENTDQQFDAEDHEPSQSQSILSPNENSQLFTQVPPTTIISFGRDINTSPSEMPRGPFIQNGKSALNNRVAGIQTKHLMTNKYLANLETLPDKNTKVVSTTEGELVTTSVPNETRTIFQNPMDESQKFGTETTTTSEDFLKGLYNESHPGQYHEVNPGQYHEINPGQDHEIHPGQNQEINPGQYHEVNPGQYHESNPGQYEEEIGVDNVTVNFDHNQEHDTRIYNVKASAGDFIIGEVGRIDINSGQTLQGVRYTAVEGEVDQARISDILARFFGTKTR